MAFFSHFEVEITPTKKRDSEEGDETPVLEFRPFARIPKVIFKNVFVGDSVSRSIVLRNPQKEPIEIELGKLPPQEVGLTFSENKIHLLPSQEALLTVHWRPKAEGKSIHSVLFKTNTNTRCHISIVCVSIQRKAKRVGKGTLSKSTIKKKVVLKSENVIPIKRKETEFVDSMKRKGKEQLSECLLPSKIPVYSSNILPNVSEDQSKRAKLLRSIEGVCDDRQSVEEKCAKFDETETLENLSSGTYDLNSPEPRRLSNEKRERILDFNSEFCSIETLYSQKGNNVLAEIGFSPVLPSSNSIPPRKSSRETYILVPTLSSPSDQERKVLETLPESLEVSEDSLSPKENHPPILCKVVEDLDLDVSGLSELESFVAKKSTNSNNDPLLELSIPSITPLPNRKPISKEDLLRAVPQNFEVNKVECLKPSQSRAFQCHSKGEDVEKSVQFSNKFAVTTSETSVKFSTPLKKQTSFSSRKYSFLSHIYTNEDERDNELCAKSSIGSKTHENFSDVTEGNRQCGNVLMPTNFDISQNTFEIPVSRECITNFHGQIQSQYTTEDSILPAPVSSLPETYKMSKPKEYPPTFCQGIEDLDISGLSEVGSFIAKKCAEPNINISLELTIPPITPVHNKELFSREKFLKDIPQNFGTVRNESIKVSQELQSGYKGNSGTEYVDFSQNVVVESMQRNLNYSTPLNNQISSRTEINSFFSHTYKKEEGRNDGKTKQSFFIDKPTTFSAQSENSSMSRTVEGFKSLSAFKEPKAKVCLTFSAPRKQSRPKKENVFPGSASTKMHRTKQQIPKLTPFQGRKGSIRQVLRETQGKKELSYPISKLILSSKKKENTVKETTLMNPEKILSEQSNPSYCITSTIINPFLNSAIYYDQQWFDARENEFVRWLNVLLTPPEQLSSSDELPKVDVADLWKHSCKSNVAPAPSRETVSSLYLVNHRLDSLRRKACAMFSLPSVAHVLSKVMVQIDKGMLSIRKDRNIVRDIGLKCVAVELLLCYNPLWLRIGLETIMGRTIALESNSDVVGMTGFIARNILSDPYLVQQYSYSGVTNMFKPGYEEAVKKHILKKFFLLVFFLDYAKENKLIVHNPCLFCKDAQYKESRDLLLAFARDFLAGIGDVTKHLKHIGYVVTHKQTYLDEFNYAVTHLGSDLRDGVRLTRVTEIILQEPSLSSTLRTPAISKLQKMHNVKVAMQALSKAGHAIEGDISPKDIVEGHREKTMSLLWQIIYRFQLTRFTCAASRIQKWFRSLPIVIKRRIWLRKEAAKRRLVEIKASIVIQKFWRCYIVKKQYKIYIQSVIRIQNWLKSVLVMKRIRAEFLHKRNAAIKIQRFFRSVMLKRRAIELSNAKIAAMKIIVWYRRICFLRRDRENFKKVKNSVVTIQRWYRATRYINDCRSDFISKKNSALKIQRWYRSVCETRTKREYFLNQKSAAICIQRRFRATILMKKEKQFYENKKRAAIKIQSWYRGWRITKSQRIQYLQLKGAAIKIQKFYKLQRTLQTVKKNTELKESAAKKIQFWIRSIQLMRADRENYRQLRKATVILQRRFRAKQLGHHQKLMFNLQRSSAIIIQNWYRSLLLMKIQKKQYEEMRAAVLVTQKRFRSIILARKERRLFISKLNAAVKIQQWYRSAKIMHNDIEAFQRKMSAVRVIQCWFRGTLLMKRQKALYRKIYVSVVKIQIWYRSTIQMKRQRKIFLAKKQAAIKIQRFFRSFITGRRERKLFCLHRKSAIILQTWYRSVQLMKHQRKLYSNQMKAAVCIQHWWRSLKKTQIQRSEFVSKRNAAIKIQVWYRSCIETRKQRSYYILLKHSVEVVQSYYRVQKLKNDFKRKRKAARKIQLWYKAICVGRQERLEYHKVKTATVKIQVWFRATRCMREERRIYLLNKKAVIVIQQKFRAWQLGQQQRRYFRNLKMSCIVIENWYRNILVMKKQKYQYEMMRRSACVIQRRYREYLLFKKDRSAYLSKRRAALTIQKWYRKNKLKGQQLFSEIKIKSVKLCPVAIQYSEKQVVAVKIIEKWYYSILEKRRRIIEMKKEEINKLHRCAKTIQACWRGYYTRKKLVCKPVKTFKERYVLDEEKCLTAHYKKGLKSFCCSASYAVVMSGALLIEICVSLSPKLCEEFINSEAFDTLVDHLGAVNRSVPAEKLLIVAIQILTHLLRCASGVNRVINEDKVIKILLNLTSAWDAKKHESLFCHICTVWWLLGHSADAQEVLKRNNAIPQLVRCYKKLKDDKNKKKTSTKKNTLPSLFPAWTAKKNNHVLYFESGFFAISEVMKVLKISEKFL